MSSENNQNDGNENLNPTEKKKEVVLKKQAGYGTGLNLMKQVLHVKQKLQLVNFVVGIIKMQVLQEI